nr:uncharacterized protein LOC100630573 isoform X2 [Equus caballus]
MDSDTSPGALEGLTHKRQILGVDLLSCSLSKDHFASALFPLQTSISLSQLLSSPKLALETSPPPAVCSLSSWMLLDSSEVRSPQGPLAMAGLRYGRPNCIRAAFGALSARAGFRKRQRNMLHRLKFLDPYGDSEDTPGHSSYSFKDCFLGSVHCNVPSHTPKSRSPEEVNLEDPLSLKIPDLVKKAAGWAPASLGANDVDMQPVEASGAEARGWAARLPGAPEDTRMIGEVGGSKAASPLLPAAGAPQTGRHTQGRARVSQQVPRPPPRLGSERDKGPRLSLSKRKLELLLPEPEKSKRKRQYVA